MSYFLSMCYKNHSLIFECGSFSSEADIDPTELSGCYEEDATFLLKSKMLTAAEKVVTQNKAHKVFF